MDRRPVRRQRGVRTRSQRLDELGQHMRANLAEQMGEATDHRPVAQIAQVQDSRLVSLLKVLLSERV